MKLTKNQTVGEEIANSISHGIMVLFGIAVLLTLIIRSGYNPYKLSGAIIYGFSVTLLYIFSCIYHALGNGKAKWSVFKRLDHLSIYLLIGGTYAPILLNLSSINNHV
jgi:hemolysin III